jgi:hypothetical protein
MRRDCQDDANVNDLLNHPVNAEGGEGGDPRQNSVYPRLQKVASIEFKFPYPQLAFTPERIDHVCKFSPRELCVLELPGLFKEDAEGGGIVEALEDVTVLVVA